MKGRLYYGDNLTLLRQYVDTETVDLVYLDPPFNSNAEYSTLFVKKGDQKNKQLRGFSDSWVWTPESEALFETMSVLKTPLADCLRAFRVLLKERGKLAYLVMIAARLIELHRVMKSTASLYLHCDPTASHYLKILLDVVFGVDNFRAEIIWKRSSAHNNIKQGCRYHGRIHDVLLFYTKTKEWKWNPLYTPYDKKYTDKFYRHIEPGTGRRYELSDLTGPGGAAKGNPAYEIKGVTRHWRYGREKMEKLIKQGRVVQTKPGTVPRYKLYLDEMPGTILQDIWADIPPLGPRVKERTGFPTQKPETLLNRVIQASSNKNDTVLDPFCGSGTTLAAAQKLERRWIGIDASSLAIELTKERIQNLVGIPCVSWPII